MEAQIPVPVPIPGVKLGLANIITVTAMFTLGPGDMLYILLARIFLGSVFSGAMATLFYSLGGGLLCYLSQLLLRRFLSEKQIWICSVVGAVFHNLGQILVAAAVMKTLTVFAYLPVLMLSGVITGLFTGLCAQFLVNRLKDKLRS